MDRSHLCHHHAAVDAEGLQTQAGTGANLFCQGRELRPPEMPQDSRFRAEEGNSLSQDNGTAINNLYRSDVRLTQYLHNSVLQSDTTNVPDDQVLQTWSLEQLEVLAQQPRADESNLA